MEAQSADGVVHEFPDGTDPIVIDRVMKSYAQPQLDAEAGSAANTAKRIGINTVTGIPDFAAEVMVNRHPLMNVIRSGAEMLGYNTDKLRLPSARGAVMQATGVPEMPSDAGLGRQFIEAAVPAAITGGVGAGVAATRVGAAVLPAVARSIMPAMTSTATSMAGGEIGQKIGGEEGRFIGGLVGGTAPSAVRAGYQAVVPGAQQMQPKPNAAAIEADARSLNLPSTPAGVLGDKMVQQRERQLAGTGGGGPVITAARENFAQGMRDAAGNIVEQRTAIPAPTPNTAPVIQLAEQTRAAGGDVGRALQQDLMNSIGNRTPVNISPIMLELQRLRSSTDPGTFAPLAARQGHLETMAREANLPSAVPGLPPHMVPYEQVKDWRSNLGASLEGQAPVRGRFHGQAYGAVTDQMRDTAMRQGVHPEAFDVAQRITSDQYMGAKLADQVNRSIGQDKAAAARQFNTWWQTRTPEAQARLAGDPAIRAQLDALSRVAGEFNYPTGQTGLNQALGGQLANSLKDLARRVIAGGVGHAIAGSPGAFIAGAGYDKFIGHPLEARTARRFEGTAPQLARGPQPVPSTAPNNIARALAIMTEAGIGRRQ